MSDYKNMFWVERYRPKTINDYIFHDQHQKSKMLEMIANKDFPHILMSGIQGSGKAQPLDAKVLTPSGWITMGEVQPGTIVKTPSGDNAEVLSIHPQGTKDIYSITFHDGSTTECCADHLWDCWIVEDFQNRKQIKKTISTNEIIQYMNSSLGKNFNISIDLIKPVEYDNSCKGDIDPYVLGVLIGDGSLTTSVRFTSIDSEIVEQVKTSLGDEYVVSLLDNHKEWSISDTTVVNLGGKLGHTSNRIKANLTSYGLWGKHSHEKFIPDMYKVTSVIDRISLLQGLFDTDGTVSSNGAATFTTTSARLAHDVQYLLWSLGATCSMSVRQPTYTYNGKKCKGRIAYDLRFNHPNGTRQFFRLSRKQSRAKDKFAIDHNKGSVSLRRRIQSVVWVGQKEAQCIMVNHTDHLYITDDFITTHNTTAAYILINELNIIENDVLVINASDENSVDTIRDRILKFAKSAPVGDFKVVLLEEADYITLNGQGALRRVMEENAETCRFILTCNYEHKLIPAIISRCTVKFRFKSPDRNDVTEYLIKVLASENIVFNLDILDKYIAAGYPDIRNCLSTIQQYCIDGKLQSPNNLMDTSDYKFMLLELIEKDKWVDARKIVCEQVVKEEYEDLYTFLYKNIHTSKKFQKQELWEEAIIVIAEHLKNHHFVADPEINAAAMFIRLGMIK